MGSISRRSVLLVVAAIFAAPAIASSSAGPWTNLTVCAAPGGRSGVKITSDGHGGAIIAWQDERNKATNLDVYIQGINAGGITKWTPGGVPLCTAVSEQYNVALGPDGDGGSIVAWSDYRDPLGYVFAQRVDSRGTTRWARDGISVAPAQNGVNARVEPDGFGGSFVAWEALAASRRGIHVQRLDAEGRLLWGPSGVPVCTAPGFHSAPSVVSDGAGGVFAAWTDLRGPSARVFAQHLNSSGVPVWNVNGIPVCGISSEQRIGTAVSDGAGGVVVVWRDSRKAGPEGLGLFAQRVNDAGQLLWDREGVDLCSLPLKNDLFIVACANLGGAIIAWHDDRSGQYDIRAQSVSVSGRVLWDADGAAVCIAPRDQIYPAITTDSAGGAFLTWQDFRDPSGGVYVQHAREDGSMLWGTAGVPTSTTANMDIPAIAGDGRGGAFVAWIDGLVGFADFDVLAERITDSGREGRRDGDKPRGSTSGRSAVGARDGDGVSVRLSVGASSYVRVGVYDLTGRRIRALVAGHLESGENVLRWDGRDEMGRRVGAGVYFVQVQTEDGQQTLRTFLTR